MKQLVTTMAFAAMFIFTGASVFAQPVNDSFRSHAPIYEGVSQYTGTNVGAIPGEVTPSCGGTSDNAVWYAITVFQESSAREVTFDTFGSGYDTVLSAWTYANGTMTEVDCNDDATGLQSELTLSLSPNIGVYLIAVSGFNQSEGDVILNVTGADDVNPPDDWTFTKTGAPGMLAGRSHPSTNIGADQESQPPPSCNEGGGTNDVWRSFIPASSGFVTIDTFGSDFDTVLAVYQPFGTEIGCNDDSGSLQSEVSNLEVTAGALYYARVAGFRDTNSGLISLNVSDVTSTPVSNEETAAPNRIALAAAYPNPFAAQTTLAYSLGTTQEVRIVAYDVLGREVAVLAEGIRAAGQYEATFDAAGLPSGIYIVRLTAGKTTITRRVTAVR